MNNDEKPKDIFDQMKTAGYNLAQKIYFAENSGIGDIKGLIKKYTGKMFNYIHNNKASEFLLYLEKICAGIYIQPPKPAIELLRARDTRRFKEYALAFMMGFMSEKKEKTAAIGGKSE